MGFASTGRSGHARRNGMNGIYVIPNNRNNRCGHAMGHQQNDQYSLTSCYQFVATIFGFASL